MQPMKVYIMNISYFSGKFEAYLRYKDIPYERIEAHHKVLFGTVYRHTGTMKVPAVELPDGRWLKDTTPMIRWFEEQHPDTSVIPSDARLKFLASLIEDYADEWLWRPAMWWRWMPRGSRVNLAHRLATEVLGSIPGPTWIKAIYFTLRQQWTWLWGDGMTRKNQAQIRDMYPQQLAALESIFQTRPFLLGEQPSIADFGYFASMFKHFGNDPDSGELMRKTAPNVNEWLARLWNAKAKESAPDLEWVEPTGEGWDFIWQDICQRYLPYLQQNAQAFGIDEKRFDYTAHGLSLPKTKVSDYRVWCLQTLRQEFAALDKDTQQQVLAFLNNYGGIDALTKGADIDSGLNEELKIPFESRPLASWSKRLRVWIIGNARQTRA